MDVDIDEVPAVKQKVGLFSDPRFVALFEDPGFGIDAQSREFAPPIPPAAAQRGRVPRVEGEGWGVVRLR
jgi:NUC153 domain